MNPQMTQYGQPSPGGYPAAGKGPQHLPNQMQGLSLGPNTADPYGRPAQHVANGGPQARPNAVPPQYAGQYQPSPAGGQPMPPGQSPYPNGAASANRGYPPMPQQAAQQPQLQQQPAPGLQNGPHASPAYPAAPRNYSGDGGGQPNYGGSPAVGPPQGQPPAPQQYARPVAPQPGYGPPPGQGYAPSPQNPPTAAAAQPYASPQQPGYPPQQARMPPAPMPGYPSPLPPQQAGMPPQQHQPGMPPLPQPGYNATSPYGPGGALPPQPGKPPYPGPDQYGPNPGYPAAPAYNQQSSRRIEPDQLPSVIQVMEDDEKSNSGVFCTNQRGLMPPLMTTNFLVQDGGNCSPRFARSTLYNVPVNSDMMKQMAVPFAIVVSPMARLQEGEYPPPVVDMGQLGPVRCIRCKAYMSPFMQFVDGGRRFQCLLCKATTDVPEEYFQHLDQTGLRVDRFERPELLLGAYEFVATKDYCRNNTPPNPPAIVFVIDVSYNNVRNGLLHLLCDQMKEILRSVAPPTRVGFITYGSSVHFYNIKGSLAAPQMVIVGDVGEMFMPLLDGFLSDPNEAEAVIDLLMQEVPKQFADTRETEIILLPAIQAGLEALKAAECPGKLLVFHSSLPTGEAPGKLKNRDDRKVLATEKEKTVLTPQIRSYNEVGQECVQAGVSVDLFLFNNSYVDLPTVGQVSRLTGGEIFKYTYFQADIDGERFIADLKMDLSREVAYDAIMRIRTSTGVRATDFYGHFFMSNTTDVELAAIDSDKAVAVEIKHDDKLTEEDGVYIQVALLYTHVSGQRRLRILNLGLKTCSQMADMYRSADLDTLINFFAKQGVTKLLELTPKQVKENLSQRCATTLACYRKNCASPSSIGQLILPECMKLLPLYVNTLMKSDAFSGGSDMTVDDRSFAMHAVLVMDVNLSIVYFYPRLVALHTDPPFPPVRCSFERLHDDGLYLLDNGIHMFLWVGMNASPELVSQLFGVPSGGQVDADRTCLPVLDNPYSEAVRNLVEKTRIKRHRHMRLTIVKQRDKLEMVMKHFLMEDAGMDGSPSYVDFLCHMHKEIRTLLS